MKTFKRRGKRIRASDVSLVLQFVFFGLAGVWLISFVPFHLSFLLSTTWQLDNFQAHFMSTYGLVSMIVSLIITACCAIRLTIIDTNPYEIEEHTSELQSRFDLVCRLLLEKKNK